MAMDPWPALTVISSLVLRGSAYTFLRWVTHVQTQLPMIIMLTDVLVDSRPSFPSHCPLFADRFSPVVWFDVQRDVSV